MLGPMLASEVTTAQYDKCWMPTFDVNITLEALFNAGQKDRQTVELF